MNKDAYVRMRVNNAAHHAARDLKRTAAQRAFTDSLDALTLPPNAGDDLPVLHLPSACKTSPAAFYAHIECRDALAVLAATLDAKELQVANLFLQGHSPHVIFRTLGIPFSTGYREYASLFRRIKEACHA